jgi:hypothetical protein
MSITAFLALAILGCDFMLYFLFKLLYGEKRSRAAPLARPPPPPSSLTALRKAAHSNRTFLR